VVPILQRASQPLAHPLEQRQPVLLPLAVAFARLAGQDHHPVDVRRPMPQGHRESADKRRATRRRRMLSNVSLPRPARSNLRGQILRLAHVVVGEQSDDSTEQPASRATSPKSEKPRRILVEVQQIAQPGP